MLLGLLEQHLYILVGACQRFESELLLAVRKVVVEGTFRTPALFDDLRQPGAVIALLLEQSYGRAYGFFSCVGFLRHLVRNRLVL